MSSTHIRLDPTTRTEPFGFAAFVVSDPTILVQISLLDTAKRRVVGCRVYTRVWVNMFCILLKEEELLTFDI